MIDLPKPRCKYGYPRKQLEEILGPRLSEFGEWAGAITATHCDGQEYNHRTKAWHATGCGPHGVVIYRSDVEQFLAGGGSWD